jgi:transposase-like protein
MKAKRYTEDQIIAVLREAEAGAKTKELCRKYGISEPTFYNWKAARALDFEVALFEHSTIAPARLSLPRLTCAQNDSANVK